MSNILTSDTVAGLAAANLSASNPAVGKNEAPNGISITKTTSGVQILLPAVSYDRVIIGFYASVTEAYTSDSGTPSVFSLGETGNANRWGDENTDGIPYGITQIDVGKNLSDITGLEGDIAKALFDHGCDLAANKSVIATCTPAVGDGTGGCKIVAIAVRAP